MNPCMERRYAQFTKSLSIILDDDTLRVTIPEAIFENHDKICLYLAQPIPDGITADTTVVIEVGSAGLAKMPVITKWGNLLYADALTNQRCYTLYAATDTSAFVLYNMCYLGKTAHVFPTVPESAPKATNKSKKELKKSSKSEKEEN